MMMSLVVTMDQRRAVRREMIQQMEQGATASDVRRLCPIPIHRTTVYRLLKRVEREGEQAFVERRHGHPTKLRGDVLTWVLEYCQSHASASSSELQCLVAERFSLDVACQSTEPCPCRSRTEPPRATARKKSRKRASRLPQDIMNRLGAC